MSCVYSKYPTTTLAITGFIIAPMFGAMNTYPPRVASGYERK
jgi:hypothetical protein